MFPDRMGVLFRRSEEILQRDGLLLFIKRAFLFSVRYLVRFFFNYGNYYIYEKTLNKTNEFEFTPKTQNPTLKILYTPMEVDELIAEGFDFSSYSNIENLKEGLSKGAMLFGVFIGRELAHTSWVAMNNATAIYDPLFQKMNYRDAGYIGPCNTNQVYLGFGLYPYTLTQICKFLKEMGKSKALINTSKSNLPSIRGIIKAGFRISGEARYLKLLFWEFWEEKSIKGGK